MKVIFLDRDGIINRERGDYTWLPSQFEFTTNLFDFLRNKSSEGFSFIVITNQGGINKGLYDKEDVENLHNFMIKKLEEENIQILDIYYCPHHSDFQKCLCRKPGSLLFEKAIAVYSIDQKASFMIGDRQRDIEASEKAGIRGVLLESNPDWRNVKLEG